MTKIKTMRPIMIFVTGLFFISACQKSSEGLKKNAGSMIHMHIEKTAFGMTQGRAIDLYTLTGNHVRVKIMTYGAIVVSLETPDRNGTMEDIVLGYEDLDGYVQKNPYFGAIVGRYGNRIGQGKFNVDGSIYQLSINDGKNHLHGGHQGFDKVVWEAEPIEKSDTVGVRLHYLSPDGEEGYPGNLSIEVCYLLTTSDELWVTYKATTDQTTIVNPTHHSYFNLTGKGNTDILDHRLQIMADYYTPVDQGLIPTGELRPVEGTPFDFRQPVAIGARINQDDMQLKYGKGYDHNWVLNAQDGSFKLAARVKEPGSGRILEISTTEPGIQFYSGNFLDGSIVGKKGVTYNYRSGFCLEAQHYPDSPNKPQFPSVVLKPGETYTQVTVHRFYAD